MLGTYTNPPTTVDYAGTLRIYVVGHVTRSLLSKELGTAGLRIYRAGTEFAETLSKPSLEFIHMIRWASFHAQAKRQV
jgi:hypothetical protein